jgi:hypothetical protein
MVKRNGRLALPNAHDFEILRGRYPGGLTAGAPERIKRCLKATPKEHRQCIFMHFLLVLQGVTF